MARGHNCQAHKHHQLVPIEVHHIWPRGYHGPDVDENKIAICSNAHSDVHYLLEALLKGKNVDKREYGPVVRQLAQRGYEEVMNYAASIS